MSLKLSKKPAPLLPPGGKALKYEASAKIVLKKAGASVQSVSSVLPKGKLTLKNTGTVDKQPVDRPRLKLLSAAARKADLEKKTAAATKKRTQHQDEQDTPLASLEQLENYVRVQLVTLPNGKQREWPVISPTASAEPLMTTAVTISRWLGKGLLPEPILETGRGACYHLEELRSFCEILGHHLTETKHYRANHADTKKLLFTENARIRNSLLDQAV